MTKPCLQNGCRILRRFACIVGNYDRVTGDIFAVGNALRIYQLAISNNLNVVIDEGSRRLKVLHKKIYRITIRRRIDCRIAAVIAQRCKISNRCFKFNVNPLSCAALHLLKRQDYRRGFCTAVTINGIHPRNRRGCPLVIIRRRRIYVLRNKFTRNQNIHRYRYRRPFGNVNGERRNGLIILRTIRRTVGGYVMRRNRYVSIAEGVRRFEIFSENINRRTIFAANKLRITAHLQHTKISYVCIKSNTDPLSFVCRHRIIAYNGRLGMNRIIIPYRIYPVDRGIAVHRTRNVHFHFYRYKRTCRQIGRKAYEGLIVALRRRLRARRHCFPDNFLSRRNEDVFIGD